MATAAAAYRLEPDGTIRVFGVDGWGIAPVDASREDVQLFVQIMIDKARGEGAATANDIANGGCAVNADRRQAAAAAPTDSLQRPAVE